MLLISVFMEDMLENLGLPLKGQVVIVDAKQKNGSLNMESHQTLSSFWADLEADINKHWFRYKIYWPIRRGIGKIYEFFRYEIKYFIQRGRRGYDDHSHWSGETYIANIFAGIAEDLVENKHSYPEHYDGGFEQYISDVERVAKFFREYTDLEVGNNWSVERYNELIKEQDWVFEWLKTYFGSLWD